MCLLTDALLCGSTGPLPQNLIFSESEIAAFTQGIFVEDGSLNLNILRLLTSIKEVDWY